MFKFFQSGTRQRRTIRNRRPLGMEALEDRTLLAANIFVDANNGTGVMDGTALHPYTTVQAAVTAAPADSLIKVAQGTYAGNVVIPDASLQLLGGFAGGPAAAYAAGQPGDFAAADPTGHVTRITGDMDAPVLFLQNVTAKSIVIDGFVISGGHTGIYVVADYLQYANVTISHNVIENNGPAELQPGGGTYAYVGGGIYSSNATLAVTHNTIRNNNANRAGGLYVASKSDFTVTDNLIENNSGYDDHCGGVWLYQLPISAAGNGVFSRNVIRGNVAAKAYGYGWGGGALISGDADPATLKPLTLSNNIWTGNSAPSQGGAIFVDNGATVVLDHELICKNSTTSGSSGGGAIFVDGDGGGTGTSLTIRNSTIADNSSGQQIGNGVFVMEFSHVAVSNSIFWGNTDDFFNDNSSAITVKYTDSQEIWPGTGNLHADPLFANPAGNDYHLQSTAGRFDPAPQGGAGGWVVDPVHSPAIDAGDPAAAFANEPASNGGRVNLGADGNTLQASRSNTGISLSGGTLDVSGTSGADTFVISEGTNLTLTRNGIRYVFPAGQVSVVNVHGNEGGDQLTFTGTAGDEKATLRPGTLDVIGPGYKIHADSIEDMRVAAGSGGTDTANLYDSAGNDTLTGRPTYTQLVGTGFFNRASGFDRVNAYATAGDAGGVGDRAYFYDSAGNDTFLGRPDYSQLTGTGFFNYASGFDRVNAYATAGDAGGVGDRANLYDSAGNDTFLGRPDYSQLTGTGFFNYASGFDRVNAYATAGDAGGVGDRANLYDSAGNDTFIGNPTSSSLYGTGFNNYAGGFDRVNAYATAGDAGGVGDRANLYDSVGNDTFYGRSNYGYLTGVNFYNYVAGFDRVNAYANAGGDDALDESTVDYLFSKFGSWENVR